MRRADRDHYTRLTNFQSSGAVHNADVCHLKSPVGFVTESLHFAQRHWLVSFVNEVLCLFASRPLSSVAVQCHGGATLRQNHSAGNSSYIEWTGGDFKKVLHPNFSFSSSPAYRREHCYFVVLFYRSFRG